MDPTLLRNPVERRKAVRLKVRPDLQITDQRYEGKIFHVVKDPVCLRYYRFNKQEYYVFDKFDGEHTMEQVKDSFEDEFKPHRLEYGDLEGFARQLVTAGLVQSETVGTGKHLFTRRAKQRRMKRLAAVTSVLYWKIPVFDPDRILTFMFRYLAWVFTVPFFVLSVSFMLAAAIHVTLHFDTFYTKIPALHEFFQYRTVLYMWLSLGVVKVIHEFGHGLSCKAFGGECHEMGILLMCLSPALYCNVTDAWTISDKWKRIIISFAGIYVELIIAAASTFVWWYTPDKPVVNNIALCLMTLCSVSTFVFNANPLMRFDGYYIMADWLEIPNLRDRSNKYITNLFLEKALGVEVPPEQYMAPTRKLLFISYAVASWVYRWVVTFSIIWVLADMLGEQLKVISHMIAIMSLASMFVWPAYRMVKNITQRGRLPDMKAKRVLITSTIALAILGIFFFVPLPISRVRETAIVGIDPNHALPLGLSEPATLASVEATDGQMVKEGQVLLRLSSPALSEEIKQALAKQREALQVAADLRNQIESQKDLPPATVQTLMDNEAQSRAKADDCEREVQQLRRRESELSDKRAPRDGAVMGMPRRSDVGKLFDRNFLDTRPLVTVADLTRLQVKVPLNPNEFKLVKDDLAAAPDHRLEVAIYVKGRTDKTFTGWISRVPESDAKQVPMGLTQRGGGPLAVKPAGEDGRETVPVAQTYLVEVDVHDPDRAMQPGTLVNAKIYCRWHTGAWWVARAISTALDIGLY